MGFDLHGLKPIINKKESKKMKKLMKKWGDETGWFLDWKKDIPKNVSAKYFKLRDKHHYNNPGIYFRSNVWWWRPIWQYVSLFCDDFLNVKDMEAGEYNDGKEICKTKALKIASRFNRTNKDGTMDAWVKIHTDEYEKAKKHNKKIQKQLDKISKECCIACDDDTLVPADFPEPFKTKWNAKYAEKNWNGSYPTSKDALLDFSKFCKESGGFDIL